jgi:hypothetical protein
MVLRDMLTLELTFMGSKYKEIVNRLEELSSILNFSITWSRNVARVLKPPRTSYSDILWDSEQLTMLLCHRKDLTTVEVYSNDGQVKQFEALFKGLVNDQRPSPVESFLVCGDVVESGPLLRIVKDPVRCFSGVMHNTNEVDDPVRQIRVIGSELGDLNELLEIAQRYSLSSEIIGNSLWIDFWWSEYSESWTMKE